MNFTWALAAAIVLMALASLSVTTVSGESAARVFDGNGSVERFNGVIDCRQLDGFDALKGLVLNNISQPLLVVNCLVGTDLLHGLAITNSSGLIVRDTEVKGGSAGIFVGNSSKIQFDNVTLTSTFQSPADWVGLVAVNSSHLVIQDLHVRGGYGVGVQATNVENVVIRGSSFSQNNSNSTQADGVYLRNSRDIVVEHNLFEHVKGSAVHTDGSDNISVTLNKISAAAIGGIWLNQASRAVVEANDLNGIGFNGIYLCHVRTSLVKDNRIQYAFGIGLDITNASMTEVIGNEVMNSEGIGIVIEASRADVISNTVTGGASAGVSLRVQEGRIQSNRIHENDGLELQVISMNDVTVTSTYDDTIPSILEIRDGTILSPKPVPSTPFWAVLLALLGTLAGWFNRTLAG